MGTSPSIITPASVFGLACLLSAACSPAVGHREAVAGVPQPRDSASLRRGQVPLPAAASAWTPAMPLTGHAIKCENGVIKTFLCQNVELLSYLPQSMLGESAGRDLWGWHDSTTGREFVIIGGAATAFVEVTDPVNPRYLGVLPLHDGAGAGVAQSVKVYQHYAFIGYENSANGIQVFDLTQLRGVKRPTTFKETAHYADLSSTHTIALNQATGFVYANGSNTCGGGLHMIDVRTPTKPVFAGCYPETVGGRTQGYVHDTQCVVYRGPDQKYKGREICVNYAVAGIGVVDVTDKKTPKAISSFSYPDVSYTHQGWFTEDQRYIFVDDEHDVYEVGKRLGDRTRTRTLVFDMSDLDDPVLAKEYFAPVLSLPHNLYIRGRYMYQANYSTGLRIIDVADPKDPKEVGYLSRKKEDEMGPWAWGPYPYFKNGVIAVSMSTGLVLARLLKR